MVTFGLEEEFFILNKKNSKQSLSSLYFLFRLLIKNPFYYYKKTAYNVEINFKKLNFLKIGSLEYNTSIKNNPKDIITEIKKNRKYISSICPDLIVLTGNLFDLKSNINTSGLHIHIGNCDLKKTYNNILHFLPLINLISLNSPYYNNIYFGKSFRLNNSEYIGKITKNKQFRFQDLIISKRLNTVEIRCLDPIIDLNRLELLLNLIEIIVNSNDNFKSNVKEYNKIRKYVFKLGYNSNKKLFDKLVSEIKKIDYKKKINYVKLDEYLTNTESDQFHEIYNKKGILASYKKMDEIYRYNSNVKAKKVNVFFKWFFAVFFVLIKLPYDIYKIIKEN